MPPKGPVSVLVYHPDEAQAYARLVRAPRGQVRLRVASTPETALPFVEEMDVLYTWGFPTEFLPMSRRLKWVQVMGAGVNAFLDTPFPPKVVLTRVEGIFGPWMAEYVFGWLLWASQRTETLRAAQRLRRWEPINPVLLRGKTLGVVGVGIDRAGRRLRRARVPDARPGPFPHRPPGARGRPGLPSSWLPRVPGGERLRGPGRPPHPGDPRNAGRARAPRHETRGLAREPRTRLARSRSPPWSEPFRSAGSPVPSSMSSRKSPSRPSTHSGGCPTWW